MYANIMPSATAAMAIKLNTASIFTSLQPRISNEWWIGVILNRRLPWVSLKYPTWITTVAASQIYTAPRKNSSSGRPMP